MTIALTPSGYELRRKRRCRSETFLFVAPKTGQTAMSRSFPRFNGQGIIETKHRSLGLGTSPYCAVNGSPAQAVAHAILEVCQRKPTLCISGINNGENLGSTNVVSGTVGAALEAVAFGIPAIAISIAPENRPISADCYDEIDWRVPSAVFRYFASAIATGRLPLGVAFLNINISRSATLETEIRTTVQSLQNQYVCSKPNSRDFSIPVQLPISEQIDFNTLESESDV